MKSGITLKQLRAFQQIAEQGSFTRAAVRLFVTQSTLTSTLQQLEDSLGLRLFHRSTRQLALTREGEEFLPVVRRLLSDFDTSLEDIRAIAERKRGVVRVAAGMSVVATVLPRLVAEFSARYPGIEVHIRDDNGDGVARRVRTGEADIGICGKFSEDPQLAFIPLMRDPFGVACRRDHVLAKESGPVRWQALAGHTYIASSWDTSVRALIERVAAADPISQKVGLEASSLMSLYGFLREGAGFTIFSALAACYDPERALCFRPLARPVIERELCMITRGGRVLSPAATAMHEHIRRRLVELADQALAQLSDAGERKKAPRGRLFS